MTNTITNILNRRINHSFFILIFSILGAFFSLTEAHAQFLFPSPEVLQNHYVRRMEVYRTPLRFQGGRSNTRKNLEVNPTRFCEKIFYLNSFGKPDSIVHHPTDSSFYRKNFFRYDDQQRLVEYTTIDKDGYEPNRLLIQQTDNNEWLYKRWEYGHLRELQKITADSIIYETLFFARPDTTYSVIVSFNFQTNTRTRSWKGKNGEYSIETYQWFAEDGNPKAFRHTLEERTKDMKKPVFKEKTYDLDSDGNVVNKYLGRFDDPYIQCNYFKRLKKLKPIYYPEEERFRANQLIDKTEVATLYTYDGVELVLLYEVEYD